MQWFTLSRHQFIRRFEIPGLINKILIGALALTLNPRSALGSVESGAGIARPSGSPGDLFGASSVFIKIANILIFIVGAVAVIMLIIGGLRYVISQGNEKNITAAKDTILYAVIGIVVAILAFAIVNFVATSIK